jgi:hypothetical protein
MNIEERVVQLEKQMQFYKRLVIVLALVIVAGVTMGQTSDYENIKCRSLNVIDDQGIPTTIIKSDRRGHGMLGIWSSSGKPLVVIGANDDDKGTLTTYSPSGKNLVELGATVDGGAMAIYNKTGEQVIQLASDEYGNGEVGVFNRKGKGRVYDSQ